MLAEALDVDLPGRISTGQLTLRAADGRELPHGGVARWEKRERT
jgi:hypothetical protein